VASILTEELVDQFKNLGKQLELEEWPSVFLFKFIVRNEPKLIALTTALFDDGTELRMQPSRTNKYVSISAKEMMLSAVSVIEKYKEASKIEGLIAL